MPKPRLGYLLLLATTMACSGDQPPEVEVRWREADPGGNPATATPVADGETGKWIQDLSVSSSDSARLIHFRMGVNEDRMTLVDDTGTHEIQGRRQESGFVVYEDADGRFIAEIFPAPGGDFSLRDRQGKTLWNVDYGQDRVSITHPSEGEASWTLIRNGPNEFHGKDRDSRYRAVVSFMANPWKVQIQQNDGRQWNFSSYVHSPGWGLVAFDDIPAEIRGIMLSQMLQRNQLSS